MHRQASLFVFLTGAFAVAAACSSPAKFKDPIQDDDDASVLQPDAGDVAQRDGFGGTSDSPGCVNLECRQVNCASQGKPSTTISGVVFDPAARLPLYNVYVYVPNGATQPIEPGNVSCKSCQAPASGSPLVATTTDAEGRFTLENAPTGSNIPLVMQVGKWRRQIVISNVEPCTDNRQEDTDQTRLPKNQSEGDIPQMAFVSGCDPAECFLQRLGIDQEEFTPPDGTGRVHFYRGQDGTTIAGGNTTTETYTWWQDSANLLKYDIIFNACECSPINRNQAGGGGDAYEAMHEYLNNGGRLFTTHYHYNWFAPPTGPDDFQTVVGWSPEGSSTFSKFFVDTDFPKGVAFADWLQANSVSQNYGEVTLEDLRYDMTTVTEASTRWIYAANGAGDSNNKPVYVSFNTPVGDPPENQCGRAVFSDVHLSGSGSGTFPSYCSSPSAKHEINEKALEFLFFDLSSCVQDDTKPPPPPPPN